LDVGRKSYSCDQHLATMTQTTFEQIIETLEMLYAIIEGGRNLSSSFKIIKMTNRDFFDIKSRTGMKK